MTTFTPFDVADHLDDEETISAYLSEALAAPDPAMFFYLPSKTWLAPVA